MFVDIDHAKVIYRSGKLGDVMTDNVDRSFAFDRGWGRGARFFFLGVVYFLLAFSSFMLDIRFLYRVGVKPEISEGKRG